MRARYWRPSWTCSFQLVTRIRNGCKMKRPSFGIIGLTRENSSSVTAARSAVLVKTVAAGRTSSMESPGIISAVAKALASPKTCLRRRMLLLR